MTEINYYVDSLGNFLGGFSSGNSEIPSGSTLVPVPPTHGSQKYDMNSNVWLSPTMKSYAIYDFIDSEHDSLNVPKDIDFIKSPSIRFQRKEVFSYGELQSVIYYANQILNPDGLTFSYDTPIVKEDFVYIRDSDNLAVSRTQTISWYFSDGTLDVVNTKIRIKIYADKPIGMLQETIRRRDNNIKNIIGSLISLIMTTRPTMNRSDVLTDGKNFFKSHSLERTEYLQDGSLDLENAVRNETAFAWLSDDISTFTPYTTIRGFIINQLSMGLRNS